MNTKQRNICNRKNPLIFLVALILSTAGTQAVADPPPLTADPDRPPETLKCINVNPRWQVCGAASWKRRMVMGGVGVRFLEVDPSGRFVSNKAYSNCNELAQDTALSQALRTQASEICQQHFAPIRDRSD